MLGVLGTIVAAAINAIGSYNTEKFKQEEELTRIALVSIATQSGATQMVLQSTVDAPTHTPYPTFTPNPTYTLPPTYTQSSAETDIPVVTETEFATLSEDILFQDNFDESLSSEWTTISGTWIISNGELTALGDNRDTYVWIALKKPEWKNYKLSINVKNLNQSLSAINYPVVTVRNNTSQSKIIGVSFNSDKVYWAFIGNKNYRDEPIVGKNTNANFKSGSQLEIEVQENTFVIRINGREIQRISIPGYDSGGISTLVQSARFLVVAQALIMYW